MYLKFTFSRKFPWSSNVKALVCKIIYARSVNSALVLDMSEILNNIYIWVILVNSESVLLLALVKYMLCSHLLKTVFFCTCWRIKIPILWQKIVENLLTFLYLFCPKNGAIDFRKAFITQEWLFLESCTTLLWIAFLMLYRLVPNIRSRFNKLILGWCANWIFVRKLFSYLTWAYLKK